MCSIGHSPFQRSCWTGNTENSAPSLALYFLQLSRITSAGFTGSDSHMPSSHTQNTWLSASLLYCAHTTFTDCTDPTHYALIWTKFVTNNDHILDPTRHHIGTKAAGWKAMSYVSTSVLFTTVQSTIMNNQKNKAVPTMPSVSCILTGEKVNSS